MNGGAALVVEVDAHRIERRLKTRYCDEMDRRPRRRPRPGAGGARAKEGALHRRPGRMRPTFSPELVGAGIVPDRPDRPDLRARRAERLRPARDPLRRGARPPNRRSCRVRGAGRASMARAREAMLELQRRGAVTFDYGNNIRGAGREGGVADAFDIPGFVPEYIRPLFCDGKGPFRWAALSGDPERHRRTDRAVLELFPENTALCRWIENGERNRCTSRGSRRGSAGSGTASATRRGWSSTIWSRSGKVKRSDRHRPRPPRLRLRRVSEPRDGGDEGRQRCHRRLADPERAPERDRRRELGQRPPRRRGRHRLFDPRRHGRRGRRDGRGGAPTQSGPT